MTVCVVLPLLSLVAMTTCQSNNTIDAWSASLSTQLKSLRDRVMKVTSVAQLFANTSYSENALDADALATQLEAKLSAVLRSKEAIVTALAQSVESSWASSKGLAEATECQWSDASMRLPGLKANPIYNDSVSHDFSGVKLARDAKPSGRDICFTEALDRVFANNDPQKNLPWQYFGSTTGYHRQYPASYRGSDYDPRSRPWYTGASSGPKDVLLILDVSGSMGEFNRLALMKDAATTVLSSLTVNDYVNVVTFSSDANTFECMANTMLPADPGTIAYLTERITALRAAGATDFYKAFTLGFDVLDRSKRVGATTGCDGSRTILFLTDGVPSNTEDHLALIAERNRDSKVTIFTYALGASARVQDDIACQHNGAYTFINDGGNLRTKMQSYYKVFGATANRELFWTAPYLDASGLGMMVTAALPTYDTSQEFPELLGVVGHDILLSDFTALVSTFNSDRSYAFLVDRRGNAISHPRMSTNSNPNAAPIYQDISVLENNNSTEFLAKVREPLLSGQPGKAEADCGARADARRLERRCHV
jgi:voltage-dependent calcium channel alpha-2/delta-3